jgi:hypothetical protein
MCTSAPYGLHTLQSVQTVSNLCRPGPAVASPALASDSLPRTTLGNLSGGGVSERPKERASKAREGQPSAGSNPAATALCLAKLLSRVDGACDAVRHPSAIDRNASEPSPDVE